MKEYFSKTTLKELFDYFKTGDILEELKKLNERNQWHYFTKEEFRQGNYKLILYKAHKDSGHCEFVRFLKKIDL